MALNPYLFIGVGGTGGKTLGVIREQLLGLVKSLGIPELPRGWQFLHIDVPVDPDTGYENLPYSMPRTSYLGLTSRTSTFVNIAQGVSSSLDATGHERYLAWDCWRPYPPEAVKVNITNGAGQFRAVGRVASLHGLTNIKNAVSKAISAINDPLTSGELAAVQRGRGITDAQSFLGKTQVMVIGSVGGGSGSGMMLDVCEVVRSLGIDSVNAMVFTPEVFLSEKGDYEPGVAPNSLMALFELANSMWTITKPGEASRDTLFSHAGLTRAASTTKFGGPALTFLVGRSNGTVSLSEPNEVYSVVGHSLAEIALSEELSNDLAAYVDANMLARTTGVPDNLRLSPTSKRDLGLFTALGFGRVSLGRDYFDRYASERLLRLAVERLLDRHLERHTQGDGKTDEQVLLEAADRVWNSFVNSSGINEEGDDHNDIIDALNPLQDLDSDLASFASKLVIDLDSSAENKGIDTTSARAAASQRVLEHKEVRTGILGAAYTAMANRVQPWAEQIAETLKELIVATAAQEGLPVTKELLDRLVEHSTHGANEITHQDLKETREKLRARMQYLNTGMPGEKKKVKAGDPLIRTIAKQARLTLESEIESYAFTTIIEVFNDLIENLLKPWARSISDAAEVLRLQARPAQQRSPLARMPGPVGIPDHLRPSRVEYLLDDLESYPKIFEEELAHSAGDAVSLSSNQGVLNAIDSVVAQVISGDRLDPLNRDVQPVASYRELWIPEFGANRTPASAVVTTAFTLPRIEERVFTWLHDSRKRVGRYLQETLIDYLDPKSESLKKERSDRLVDMYSAALQVAQPLASLDPTLVRAIHNQDNFPHWLKMSPISVPSHMTELIARLKDVTSEIFNGAEPRFSDEPSQGVTIVTSFANTYHPLEFTSIMEPISSQWIADGSIPDFWLWRRTSPLTEWVPLSRRSLDCLLRGWFVARFLGRARVLSTTEGSHFEVAVSNDSTGDWQAVKVPGIRPFSNRDQVASMVEALPLKMIEAFHAHSLAPLAPYQTLIALGASLDDPHNALRRWIDTGEGMVDKDSAYCPNGSDRATDLVEMCDTIIKSYSNMSQEPLPEDLWSAQRHPRHELYSEIISAVNVVKSSATVDESSPIGEVL